VKLTVELSVTNPQTISPDCVRGVVCGRKVVCLAVFHQQHQIPDEHGRHRYAALAGYTTRTIAVVPILSLSCRVSFFYCTVTRRDKISGRSGAFRDRKTDQTRSIQAYAHSTAYQRRASRHVITRFLYDSTRSQGFYTKCCSKDQV
jgi:hypothetical protein